MGLRQSATAAAQPLQQPINSTATSPESLAATVKRNQQLRREFDVLFADMELRCRRSALMNYHEAERFDNRSQLLQTVSSLVGALGVSGIAASVAKTSRVAANGAGVAGVLALPLCGILQFFSNGSSSLAPTVAEKAKLHVQAGAGWQRIARLTRAYRIQLQHLSDENLDPTLLSTWYREVIEASETVSKILPIRADTYVKFEKPEAVKERLDKRETLLKKYINLEVNGLNS